MTEKAYKIWVGMLATVTLLALLFTCGTSGAVEINTQIGELSINFHTPADCHEFKTEGWTEGNLTLLPGPAGIWFFQNMDTLEKDADGLPTKVQVQLLSALVRQDKAGNWYAVLMFVSFFKGVPGGGGADDVMQEYIFNNRKVPVPVRLAKGEIMKFMNLAAYLTSSDDTLELFTRMQRDKCSVNETEC